MKFSKMFIPTLKDAPKDAVLPSHALLIKAGFISQLGTGLYDFLPLGLKMLEKISAVVREEMNKAGANEVRFSYMTPSEFWRESGRWNKFGKELLRLNDRKEGEFVLSPTNEESVVNMVRGRITSYKQLPLNLYQINLKFRDEARPRFGLMRGREFVMKDAYSFHSSEDDLRREFENMHATYERIFTRLGLDFRAVSADSGAIGGSGSKEFMVLAANGEDDILLSSSYAANVEAAIRKPRTSSSERPEANATSKFHTPNITSIDELAEFFHVDPFYLVKAVIKKGLFDDGKGGVSEKIVVFFVRGDDELQEAKAQNASKALELMDASEAEIAAAGLVAGFCGPKGLPDKVEFYIDNELRNEEQMIIGANEKDYHIIGFKMTGFNDSRWADLVAVKEGDLDLNGEPLVMKKGIEVGHIFMLGTRYSEAMNATYLDENGKAQPFIMGCYGIGISRLIAVMVEASNDERGIIWDKKCAPFSVHIIVPDVKNCTALEFALSLESELETQGIEVLLDDRAGARYGEKIADFELIGVPFGVVIGKDYANSGEVELITRKGLIKEKISAELVKNKLLELLKDER